MSELKTPFKVKWIDHADVYEITEHPEYPDSYLVSCDGISSFYGKYTIHRQIEEGLMVVVRDDPVCIPEVTPDVTKGALNKTISQAELLHKKYKTSVDFLNIVKDIQVERGAEYEQEEGERSFEKIATVFNVYRGKDLLPSDIALILEIMKNVRLYAQDRYHLDSVIDKVSYGSLWAELVTQERA